MFIFMGEVNSKIKGLFFYGTRTSRLASNFVTYIVQPGLTMTEAGTAARGYSQKVGGSEVTSHHPS